MKHLLLALSLIVANQLYSQWAKYTTLSNNNHFDIEAANENELFVVGTDQVENISVGIVHHSIDGGITWDTVFFQIEDSLLGRLHKVNVINFNIAYVTNEEIECSKP